MKTTNSWFKRIVPMLPQQSVQPKTKESYTGAPLRPPERGAKSSNPCGDGDEFFTMFASIMVMADHDPGRDDGGPMGRRFFWAGWEVVGNPPGPSRRTPMRRDTATVGRGVSGAVGPAGQTSNQARCAVSSTGVLWRQGIARFSVPGINE